MTSQCVNSTGLHVHIRPVTTGGPLTASVDRFGGRWAGGLHEPDPLRQSCHGCLQQALARHGLQLPGYDAWPLGYPVSEIFRDQEVHENSRELARTRLGEVEKLFFFSGVVSGGFKSLAYCILYPFQQIGIFNDLQSLIFFRGLKTPTRDDVPGNMNTCCFLICRFSQTRIIQPAPGTSKRGFSYGSNCFDLTILTTFPSGSVTRRQSQKIVNGWPWLVIWIITPSSCE